MARLRTEHGTFGHHVALHPLSHAAMAHIMAQSLQPDAVIRVVGAAHGYVSHGYVSCNVSHANTLPYRQGKGFGFRVQVATCSY